MEQEIQQFQAIGGDVMISFGGASGTSLAQTFSRNNQSAVALKDSYLSLVNEFNLSHIDFDIEGLLFQILALLGCAARPLRYYSKNSPMIWYTLPVLPSGLTAEGLNVRHSALAAGIDLDSVNIIRFRIPLRALAISRP